jgi:pimeloyl-ACP methyl ester carboxylesterase
MEEYYRRFFARRRPWSADFDSSVKATFVTQAASRASGGPPCGVPGRLLGADDGTARLGAIGVPTLFAVGGYDIATPATARFYQGLVPNAELAIFDSSGHAPMHDEPERYVAVLRRFLRSAEGR